MSLIPWRPFLEPFEDADKWFENFGLTRGFVPSIDMYQDDKNVYVKTALAGVDPKNVEIQIDGNVVTISGSSEKKSEIDEKNYYKKEIHSGSFCRSVVIPADVVADNAKADFAKGMLTLVIPKVAGKKGKKIDIHIEKD